MRGSPAWAREWVVWKNKLLSNSRWEYGQGLDIYQDAGSGQLMFKVLDGQEGDVVTNLDADESARLQERLYQITQGIVDSNMI